MFERDVSRSVLFRGVSKEKIWKFDKSKSILCWCDKEPWKYYWQLWCHWNHLTGEHVSQPPKKSPSYTEEALFSVITTHTHKKTRLQLVWPNHLRIIFKTKIRDGVTKHLTNRRFIRDVWGGNMLFQKQPSSLASVKGHHHMESTILKQDSASIRVKMYIYFFFRKPHFSLSPCLAEKQGTLGLQANHQAS